MAPLTAAQPTKDSIIVIDGVREAAWGSPLAVDPTLDMAEPNLDLQGLYVVEDADNYCLGFDATASNWGMAYGIYLDTDLVDGSGATSDPWGRAVNAASAHLPEHTLYVWHNGGDWLQDVQLNHWAGGWSYDSLISQGGEQGYGPDNDWVEYRVPKALPATPLRSPSRSLPRAAAATPRTPFQATPTWRIPRPTGDPTRRRSPPLPSFPHRRHPCTGTCAATLTGGG
jgi:hypothetical protein